MSVDHYENFPVASLLLPARLRPAVRTIYHFARTADDFADEGNDAPSERLACLAAYRAELQGIAAGRESETPLFVALAAVVRQHALPLQLFDDLLDAFMQDVVKPRYADFSELLDYCRRSANPIGALMLHLFGAAQAANLRQSDAICTALQLVNFWQDVALDYRKGRIYLPQDDMARYGVTEQDIAAGRTDDRWRALIAYQIARTRAMLESGAPLAAALGGRRACELRLILQGGRRILDRIEDVAGDVFRHRPTLRARDWPPMIWRALWP